MVQIVLSVAVFVLAVAVIGLFAMMGELASRVRDPDQPAGPEHPPQPIPEARLGAAPTDWPRELAAIRDADLAHVVVFGSTCATCARIADGETGPVDVLPAPMAVVVSCPRPEAGAEFLAKHPMVTDHTHVLDVRGDWLTNNFDIGISPSVLVFTNGRLRSAHTFTSAATLSQLPTPADLEEDRVHAETST